MSKSKSRIKKNGEVFTPEWLVKEMLGKLPEDAWEPNKTFMEPAAGDGNFVEAIIKEKVRRGHDPYQALQTTYAVELMPDNVVKMKWRAILAAGLNVDDEAAREIVDRNIVQGNFLEIDDVWEFFSV
jgi:hypothetical protein